MKPTATRASRLLAAVAIGLGVFTTDLLAAEASKPHWLGPVAVATSADQTRLFVALADAKQVAAVDLAKGAVVAKVDVPGEPTSLALDAKSGRLYVTCTGAKNAVCAIDPQSMQVVQSIPAGHGANGAAVASDGSRLVVCDRFDNEVSIVSLSDGQPAARVKVSREPIGAAITPDGATALVISLVPADAAHRDAAAAHVTAIDAKSLAPTEVRLPNGSSSVRGICLSPDGKHAVVSHILSRNTMPTTQLERGWMNTNALSILDVPQKKLVGTVLLDDADLGAANPWGVAFSPDGKLLAVAHAGTHELSLVDWPGLIAKLQARQESLRTPSVVRAPAPPVPTNARATMWETSVLSPPLDPANDLSFVSGLRRRVPVGGNGPRGLAIAQGKVYVAMYFSDGLGVVDLRDPSSKAATIPLGPPPQMTEARRGEMLFHDANLCFQHWQSCASCHPDARIDGLNWDLMNDGYGNPKNTKSMLLAHRTPPAMSESVRETAEMAVRAGFRNILFRQCSEPDAKAVDAYLKSLVAVPSPHLVDGALSAAAQRGKELFFSKRIGCSECHPAPTFTDLKQHNVASRGPYDHGDEFDTPALVEAWRTAPYLHDGSAATIEELIGKGKHGKTVGAVETLSPQEIADLAAYVLSL